MALTVKQEAFCQAILSGMSQSGAYRASYNVKRMKGNAVDVEASRLVDNPNVSLRIAELKAEIAAKYLWTREMSVKALITAYKDGRPSEKVSAVKELNAMHGYNAPTKHEVVGTFSLHVHLD